MGTFGVVRLGAVLLVLLALTSFARVAPVGAQDGSVTIDLNELNDSGISGTATLTDNGDGTTTVEIQVDGATGGHPAHIHEGTCDDLNPNPQYPLASVDENGSSETDVDVSLDDLLASPYAINLHESDTNLGVYVACGEIVAADDAEDTGDDAAAGDDDAAADDDAGDDDAAAEDSGTVTIDLGELNDSGVSGTATLTDNGDGTTTVDIQVEGAKGDHPAHIHEGTCDDLNPNPKYPLANVDADGVSSTDVDVSLEDLLASPYAINIHLSADNIATYVACGNIEAAVGGGDTEDDDTADDDTGGETTVPSTGIGTMSGTSSDLAMLLGLAAVAFAFVGGGLFLRRSDTRG
jgi:hypothetical protein